MSSNSGIARFFKHSAIYAIGNALNRIGAFVLLPLYTHHLSTAQYGTLEVFYAISSVISGVLSVGIAHATLRFYFEYREQVDRNSVVSTNLIASLLITVCGAVPVLLFGDSIVNYALGADVPRWALPLVLATMVFELSSQVCLSYLRARELSVLFIAVSLGKLLVQCVANTWLLLSYDAGVEGVLAGNLLAVAGGWLVLAGFVVRHCGLRFERAKLMPVLRYSLPFLYLTIIGSAAANYDRFIVNGLLSLQALGIYALALKFSKLITDLIGEPFNRAYGAFRYTIMERADAASMQADIVRYVALMLSVVSLGVLYATHDMLRLMSPQEYWSAARLMPLLTLAAALRVLSYPLQTGILFQKSTGDLVRVGLVQAGVAVVVVPLGIWQFGLQGACAATLVDALVGAALTHRYAQRYFPVRYDIPRLSLLAGLLLLFGAVGLWLDHLNQSIVISLAERALLLLLAAAAMFASPVLRPAERRWLLERLPGLGGYFKAGTQPR